MHKHAYFKWSDAARATRVPVCVTCTKPTDPAFVFVDERYPAVRFCSAECRTLFVDALERQRVQMGAPS